MRKDFHSENPSTRYIDFYGGSPMDEEQVFEKNTLSIVWNVLHIHPTCSTCCIQSNFICHKLHESKFPRSSDFVCTLCSTGKLILSHSHLKIQVGPLQFLEHIQETFVIPQPLCGSFKVFFMVLNYVSIRCSYMCFLST